MANYGSEVEPAGPRQDMAQIDVIAGQYPPQARDDSQAAFTGGMGGTGLGGSAEGTEPQTVPVGGV